MFALGCCAIRALQDAGCYAAELYLAVLLQRLKDLY